MLERNMQFQLQHADLLQLYTYQSICVLEKILKTIKTYTCAIGLLVGVASRPVTTSTMQCACARRFLDSGVRVLPGQHRGLQDALQQKYLGAVELLPPFSDKFSINTNNMTEKFLSQSTFLIICEQNLKIVNKKISFNLSYI